MRRKQNCHHPHRSGAVAVETALVLSVFILILFGLLDLGLAVLNHNNLKDSAQQVSRAAIIRGQDAAPQLAVWGPSTYTGTAGLSDAIASSAAGTLMIMPPGDVKIVVEWPDGTCNEGDRVRTTLTYKHPLIVPSLFGMTTISMNAVSTMLIIN